MIDATILTFVLGILAIGAPAAFILWVSHWAKFMSRAWEAAARRREDQVSDLLSKLIDVSWGECHEYMNRDREALLNSLQEQFRVYQGFPRPETAPAQEISEIESEASADTGVPSMAELNEQSKLHGLSVSLLIDLYRRAISGEITDHDIMKYGDRMPDSLVRLIGPMYEEVLAREEPTPTE